MTASQPVLPIPMLDPACFGGMIKKPDEGQLSICFIGYLLLPEGRRRAYFKTDPVGYAMLNEEIGYVLARAAQLPQPDAAKIWIAGTVMHAFDPTRWPDPAQPALCWVSWEATDRLGHPAPSIKAKLQFGPSTLVTPALLKAIQDIFLKFKLLGRLIAFDAWVANIDRNIGNVLLVDSHSFLIIDHGAILGGASWSPAMHAAPDQYVETKILDGIFDPPANSLPLPTKSAIIKESALLESAWQQSAPWLATTLDPARGTAFSQAHDFLRFRASAITMHLRQRTGIVT